MKIVGARFRSEDLHAAAGASVLRIEVCADEFEFADRFHRWPGAAGNHAAAFRPGRSDAIHQDFLAAARRPADLRVPGVAGYARCEKGELFQVAYIAANEKRQIHQLLVLHNRPEIGCCRLQRGSLRRDLDNLLELAELERGIDG